MKNFQLLILNMLFNYYVYYVRLSASRQHIGYAHPLEISEKNVRK